jgi:hypothetical protein
MKLSGDMRGSWLARFARPMNAVLLLLVVSLVFHWGLASSLASANEAPRPNIALERITPVEAENHLALVRSGAQSVALLLVDQRLPSATASPNDSEGDRVGPRDLVSYLNSFAVAKALRWPDPILSPRKAFQARAPPAIF